MGGLLHWSVWRRGNKKSLYVPLTEDLIKNVIFFRDPDFGRRKLPGWSRRFIAVKNGLKKRRWHFHEKSRNTIFSANVRRLQITAYLCRYHESKCQVILTILKVFYRYLGLFYQIVHKSAEWRRKWYLQFEKESKILRVQSSKLFNYPTKIAGWLWGFSFAAAKMSVTALFADRANIFCTSLLDPFFRLIILKVSSSPYSI